MTHIRGRVFHRNERVNGRILWRYEVFNAKTGKIVARDDTCSRAAILNECHRVVEAARCAWMIDLRRKDLA